MDRIARAFGSHIGGACAARPGAHSLFANRERPTKQKTYACKNPTLDYSKISKTNNMLISFELVRRASCKNYTPSRKYTHQPCNFYIPCNFYTVIE